jgi:23S rRNA pseudouridine2605 synthase
MLSIKKGMLMMQLNKFVAQSGICSRRKAAELVLAGAIKVDGKVVKNPAFRVLPEHKVAYGKRFLKVVEEYTYIVMHKPIGTITSCAEQDDRSTIMDFVPAIVEKRLFPVGRLDIDSHGLLLLTNDGSLAHTLALPRFNIHKCYRVILHTALRADFAELLRSGIILTDGKATCDSLVVKSPCARVVDVTLHNGKNRIIRRMFSQGGYHVEDLCRVEFAGLSLKGLGAGQWRFLTKREIDFLHRKIRKAAQD